MLNSNLRTQTLILVAFFGWLQTAFAAAPATPNARSESTLTGLINLNTASDKELQLLPGIGPAKATRIIEYRTKRPFKTTQEIVRVNGIGQKLFNRLKPYLATSGQTTLAKGGSKNDHQDQKR